MSKFQWQFRDDKVDPCTAFPEGITSKRAVVPVTVGLNGNDSPKLQGMIDTGADYTFFPADFLPCLGLDITELKTCLVNVIVTNEEVPFAWVDVAIEGFQSRRIFAGFAKGMNGNLVAVLGRGGVLEHFKVLFDFPNNVFELEEMGAQ
jgi:predicted aspartyl protease